MPVFAAATPVKVTIGDGTPGNYGIFSYSGSGYYNVGDTVTVKTRYMDGQSFAGWFKEGESTLVSTATTYTFRITDSSDITLISKTNTLFFVSPGDFSIKVNTKNWDGTVEYSNDLTTWTTGTGAQINGNATTPIFL